MSDPPGKPTRRRSRRDQSQAVSVLLRRKMQQEGYDPALIDRACAAWEEFCQVAKPQIRSIQAYAAAMEYVIVLRLGGGQITQRAVAERYLVSQASIARLHPRILNCFATTANPPPTTSLPTPPSYEDDTTKHRHAISQLRFFARMSSEGQREELAHLQSLPLVRERWGAVLLLESALQHLVQSGRESHHRLALQPLFSPLCVRPRRPSDESSVVLVWMELQRHRILGWFPTESTHLSQLWELSLRLAMEQPLCGMPRRPVEVFLPAVAPFDPLMQLLQPLDARLLPLERQEIPALEAPLLQILSDVPYAFLEEETTRYREEREDFFFNSAQVALSLDALSTKHTHLWGHHPQLKVLAHPSPCWPCAPTALAEGLWEIRRANLETTSSQVKDETTDPLPYKGAWWFGWRREEESVLCWSRRPQALGAHLTSHLERRGLELSRHPQVARFAEQLLHHPFSAVEGPTAIEEEGVVWELRFQRGANLPMTTRRRLFEQGYEIAHARAFPSLSVYALRRGPLPFSEQMWGQINYFLQTWEKAYGEDLRKVPVSFEKELLPSTLQFVQPVLSLLL